LHDDGGPRRIEFALDVLVPDFKSRNRALDGDEVAVLLRDRSEWVLTESVELARPLRFRAWKDPASLPGACAAHPERVVRCAPLAPGMEEAANAAFTKAGVGVEQFSVGADGTLYILCADEDQARAVMAADGMRGPGGAELSLSRGDGPLLPLDELPARFVQAVGAVVAIVSTNPERVFCGTLRPFSKRSALFVSKDHRVPRVVVEHDTCPPGFTEDPKKFASVLVAVKITEWPADGPYVSPPPPPTHTHTPLFLKSTV
jgi:exoribonuclease R